jgi:hypothetical protein
MFSAMNAALENKGTTLADAYHDFAVAVKFNKSCSGGYTYPYCLEEGPGYVAAKGATSVHGSISSIGGSHNGNLEDNYALNWVDLPVTGGIYDIILENTSSGGQIRGSAVCDTGSELRVTPLPSVVGAGGITQLKGYNASGCSSVVAVLTNQSQTSENPSYCTSRSYQLKTSPGVANFYLPILMKKTSGPTLGFDSQFNGDSDGWVFHSGEWATDNYYLHTEGLSGSTASASYSEDFSNLDYEVKIWRYGSDSAANRIYVRGTPDPLYDNEWHSYYMFQYTREGKYSVFVHDGSTLTVLQGWASSPDIHQGDNWNRLRVVADNNSLSFYINGTLVWSGVDSTLTSGRVGIGMYRYPSTTGDSIYVDWAKLYILGGRD